MSDHHALEPDYGTGKKNLSIYVVGLVLCIILTLIPFSVVEYKLLSKGMTLLVLAVAAIAQFLVQVICFLRLSVATEQGKINVLSFIFSIVVVLVIVGGSIWIMVNLNYNMMH